jgi:hypothetical protein
MFIHLHPPRLDHRHRGHRSGHSRSFTPGAAIVKTPNGGPAKVTSHIQKVR